MKGIIILLLIAASIQSCSRQDTVKGFVQVETSDIPTEEENAFYNHLFSLVYDGELDSVKRIVEVYNVDFSKYDSSAHYTPILHASARNGHMELTRYLIDKGASVIVQTQDGRTALHDAAWSGHTEIVKLLVEKGADVNVVCDSNGGMTPLNCAAESGNIETVECLIEKRATVNWNNALVNAIYGGNLDMVKYIVEKKGAKVNRYSFIWKAYPIEVAAQCIWKYENSRYLGIVKYLVSKGARLTDINKGKNIFKWAMDNSTDDIMEFMVEQGIKIDVYYPASRDWAPLPMALDDGMFTLAKSLLKETDDYTFRTWPLIVYFADGGENSSAIIKFLIKEGINKEHYTQAFVRSVAYNDSASVQLLLDAGADISTIVAVGNYGFGGIFAAGRAIGAGVMVVESKADKDSCGVLHYATSHTMARLLIERGADTHDKMMLKHAWRNPPLIHALEDAGVVPPISPGNLNLMLAHAAEQGDVRTVEYALKRGANVNSYQLPPPSGEKSDRQRHPPAYKQTPLIKNTIQGYEQCGYDYGDHKVQISPRIAELLLNAGANPNMADTRGQTALHYAVVAQGCCIDIWPIPMGSRRDVENGSHGDPYMPPGQYHDSIAQLLIRSGANLNVRDNDGCTPLMLAVQGRNYDVLKMLLDAHADITIKDNQGHDVFHYLNDLASIKIMKEAGMWQHVLPEQLNTAFVNFFTSYNSEHDVEELKTLLDLGANVNTALYNGSMTPLEYTFDRIHGDNKFEIAQVLLDAGADLYTVNSFGYTLLMDLVYSGNDGSKYRDDKSPVNLLFLIKNGIDLNRRSDAQFTVLGIAMCEDHEEIAELLVRHGAVRDLESEWWYLTKRYPSDKIILKLQQLIKEGVNVDTEMPAVPRTNTLAGTTALIAYAATGSIDGVKVMLQLGADINHQAADGTTALSLAQKNIRQEMVETLIQAGAR